MRDALAEVEASGGLSRDYSLDSSTRKSPSRDFIWDSFQSGLGLDDTLTLHWKKVLTGETPEGRDTDICLGKLRLALT